VFDLTKTNNVFDLTTTNNVFDLTMTNNVFDLTMTNNVIITSIALRPIGHAVILVMVSVATFKTAVILYIASGNVTFITFLFYYKYSRCRNICVILLMLIHDYWQKKQG
jgi:hypothetical protein